MVFTFSRKIYWLILVSLRSHSSGQRPQRTWFLWFCIFIVYSRYRSLDWAYSVMQPDALSFPLQLLLWYHYLFLPLTSRRSFWGCTSHPPQGFWWNLAFLLRGQDKGTGWWFPKNERRAWSKLSSQFRTAQTLSDNLCLTCPRVMFWRWGLWPRLSEWR